MAVSNAKLLASVTARRSLRSSAASYDQAAAPARSRVHMHVGCNHAHAACLHHEEQASRHTRTYAGAQKRARPLARDQDGVEQLGGIIGLCIGMDLRPA